MKIRAITTCSAAGWQQYGRRMVQSWAQHWPVPLTVWTEGFGCNIPGINTSSLESIYWLAEFKRDYKHLPTANYRMDAVRFAHKTAAVIESALAFDCDYLIWVDADTITHTSVPPAFVESLLPTGREYIAWLDRVGNYPECGFYVLNMRHPAHRILMAGWNSLYQTGDLFRLAEWHDSYVLQQLVEQHGLHTRSLSGKRGARTSHPFINGPLGAYMDHLKGPRKQAGKSRRRDLKVHRAETYWRSVR